MAKIFRSLKAYLYDRSSNPLTGAFLSPWFICNYRVLLIIFSGEVLEIDNTLDLMSKKASKFLLPSITPYQP